MKIPAVFKNQELPVDAIQKQFVSEEGKTLSCFYEWNTPSSLDVLFHAKKNSVMECVFLQNLDASAEMISRISLVAEQGATIRCTIVQQGGLKSLILFDSKCAEEGASIHIQALSNAKNNQKHGFTANMIHPVPHTQSDLKVWCVANDESQTVFNGIVTIEKGAHHTEAFQKNKNLILSETATVDSIPQLFIFNDEVKCAHGSSTSTLDSNQYIYLQSRGISLSDAEAMITRGFIENAIKWIEDPSTSARVHEVLGLQAEEAL
jgi:Fe-S cluster assembly protein SufD